MTKVSIPITVYEEVKYVPRSAGTWVDGFTRLIFDHKNLKWVDNNGINTPYLVTTINKGDKQ